MYWDNWLQIKVERFGGLKLIENNWLKLICSFVGKIGLEEKLDEFL